MSPVSPSVLQSYKCQFLLADALKSVICLLDILSRKTHDSVCFCTDCKILRERDFHTKTLSRHHLCWSWNMLCGVKVSRTQFGFCRTDLVLLSTQCDSQVIWDEGLLTAQYISMSFNHWNVCGGVACCRCKLFSFFLILSISKYHKCNQQWEKEAGKASV